MGLRGRSCGKERGARNKDRKSGRRKVRCPMSDDRCPKRNDYHPDLCRFIGSWSKGKSVETESREVYQKPNHQKKCAE